MLRRAFPFLFILLVIFPMQVGAQPSINPISLDALVNDWWCNSPGGTPTYANLQQTISYLQNPAATQGPPIAQAVTGMPIDTFSVLYLGQFGAAGSNIALIELGAQLQAQEQAISQVLSALSSGDTTTAAATYQQAINNGVAPSIDSGDPSLDARLNPLLSSINSLTPTASPPPDTSTILVIIQLLGETVSLIDSQYNCGYAPITPSAVIQVNKVAQFQIGPSASTSYLPIVKAYPGHSDYALVGGNPEDRTARLVHLPTQQATPLFTDTDFINLVDYASAHNPQQAALAGGSGTLWVIQNMDDLVYGSDTSQWSQFGINPKARPRQIASIIDQWQAHTAAITAISYSPDGLTLASASLDGSARLWDTRTGQATYTLPHDGPVSALAFSIDGTLLATGSTLNQQAVLRVWEVASGQPLTQVSTGTAFSGLGATLDGGFAFGDASTVQIWYPTNGLRTVGGGGLLAFSPDRLRLLTLDYNTLAVSLWDYQTAALVATYTRHSDPVYPQLVDFSADGQLVITGDVGDNLRWWVADTGVEVGQSLVTAGLRTLDLTPRERSVLVGGWDGTLSVYAVGAAIPDPSAPVGTLTPLADTPFAPAPCVVQAIEDVNLRAGAGTEFARVDGLEARQQATADGQAVGSDGLLWYRLSDATWVRSDFVLTTGDCAVLPVVGP